MSLTVLEAVPAAVIVFWAFRIFFRKDVMKMQLLMALGMLMSVLTLFSGKDTALFMFPFFFLAIHGMTSDGEITKWYWLVLLPSIFFIPFRDSVAFSVYLLFQVVCLSVWSLIKVRRFRDLLSEYYDNSCDLSDDLNQIVIYLIASVVVLVVMLVLPENVIAMTWVAVVFSAFVAVLQFLLGSTVCNMKEIPQISDTMAKDVIPCNVTESLTSGIRSDVPDQPSDRVNDRLLKRVIDEKLYLNPMVTLVSLADELHTNRTYLSNSIHSCYNQNFSDFINSLRIEYSIGLMKAGGENINIKDVAFSSGYNNLQSFYRNFALIMDMTPKTWISKHCSVQ